MGSKFNFNADYTNNLFSQLFDGSKPDARAAPAAPRPSESKQTVDLTVLFDGVNRNFRKLNEKIKAADEKITALEQAKKDAEDKVLLIEQTKKINDERLDKEIKYITDRVMVLELELQEEKAFNIKLHEKVNKKVLQAPRSPRVAKH